MIVNRHDTLKCDIEDGVLTLRIGVEVLAKAIKLDPDLTEYDEAKGDWVEPEITDVDAFAEEVLTELIAESEDGTTLIHLALDTAAMNAIESGAEHFKLADDIIRDRNKLR